MIVDPLHKWNMVHNSAYLQLSLLKLKDHQSLLLVGGDPLPLSLSLSLSLSLIFVVPLSPFKRRIEQPSSQFCVKYMAQHFLMHHMHRLPGFLVCADLF